MVNRTSPTLTFPVCPEARGDKGRGLWDICLESWVRVRALPDCPGQRGLGEISHPTWGEAEAGVQEGMQRTGSRPAQGPGTPARPTGDLAAGGEAGAGLGPGEGLAQHGWEPRASAVLRT